MSGIIRLASSRCSARVTPTPSAEGITRSWRACLIADKESHAPHKHYAQVRASASNNRCFVIVKIAILSFLAGCALMLLAVVIPFYQARKHPETVETLDDWGGR